MSIKNALPAVVVMAMLISVVCSDSDSPTDTTSYEIVWTKYFANPVINTSNVLTEFYAIGQPTCIIENDTTKMWYVAAGLPHVTTRLIHAWSINGVEWTKHNSGASVMDPGDSTDWDRIIDTPEIVRDSSGYKLYYFGDTIAGGSNQNPSHRASFGIATSTDGINWTKYAGNPILTHGDSSDWDCHWIESPAVLWNAATDSYMMWYTGVDTSTWKIGIGLATSSDGFNWTKYAGNPVLSPGSSGSYDDMWASVPAVLKNDSIYEMWYCGLSSKTGLGSLSMNYATSYNGINWTKFSGNPLFDTYSSPHNMAIDSGGPWAPDLIFVNGQYRMWYETHAGFCFSTSNGQIVEE